jgi:MYXO-CTERM domain-containing protein
MYLRGDMHRAQLLTLLFVAAGLPGCAVEQPDVASTAGISFEEFRAGATREPGTGAYIVDWDIALHGEDALRAYWGRLQRGALSIYAINGQDIKWDSATKKNLTFCVGSSFGANKQLIITALQGATLNGWEKLADVKFVHVPAQDASCNANNPNVLFDVNLAPPGVDYLARAFFPNSPRIERNVLVAADALNAQANGVTLTNILTHELGHVLGFRHEHIRAPGDPCPEDDQFRAVTAYDKVSTMHYPQCGSPGNTLALSQLDRAGVAMIYGAPVQNMPPMASATAPINGATVPPTFRVSAAVVDTDLVRAELLIDGTIYQTIATGPFDFQITNLAVGAHRLEVRGTDSANQSSSSTINVTVSTTAGSGTGGGNGMGNGDGTGGGDGPGGGGDDDVVTGGCSTGGGGAGLALGLGLLGLVRRRRR